MFQNAPAMKNAEGELQVKRYVHQRLTGDHYGIHYVIQENGRVKVTGPLTDGEYDELEVPASLVFKLATLLKATRQVKYVPVAEAASMPLETE